MPSSNSSSGSPRGAARADQFRDWLPRAGLRFPGVGTPGNEGSAARLLSTDERNRALYLAAGRVAMKARTVHARDAQMVFTRAIQIIAGIRDASKKKEHIIDFLGDVKDETPLGKELPKDIWVEFVFRVVSARDRYLRKTPKEQIDAEADQVSDLAKAADQLYTAAGKHGNEWDWLSLEILVSPELMGESPISHSALDWE
ncbi:hypothetical protein QBC41DRAFT_306289 [Cercophora samala]|uniref:Uncharacterized protein n=1 Tax=Cercophora samala TaxID=330535 RepID=A0AA39Z7U1_9PEZI|nr:hypothetical protein QBC41DRAFT_306289 [Cercophora samala]